MRRLLLVLDTNVLISAVVSPAGVPDSILKLWRTGAIEIALSRSILEEAARVLPRLSKPKLRPDEIRDLIDDFSFSANMVEPDAAIEPALRDEADQQILATLRAANADYLITGDKDLLALSDRYPIVTPAQFWSRHG